MKPTKTNRTPLHGKEAYLRGWQKRPSPSRDDVTAWATAGNVGLRTGRVSGVVIVDVDVHRGGSIPTWAEAGGEPPPDADERAATSVSRDPETLLEGLNPQQRAAVVHQGAPLLIVAGAGSDAGVDGFITERMGGAPDHPMTIAFPEGEYLKGLVVMRK